MSTIIDGTAGITFPNSTTQSGAVSQPALPFTANGVVYASSTSALATGSGLVFDGSNLGIAITPSAWGSAAKVLEIGTIGNGFYGSASSDSHTGMVSGAYQNSGWKYSRTGINPIRFSMNDAVLGQMEWYNASSGTAGNAITWTQAMTLDASGNLLVGTTANPNGNKIYVAGTAQATGGIQEAVLSSFMNDDGSYSKTGIRAAIKAKTESGRGALPPYGIWASSQETDVGSCVGIYGKAIGLYGTQYAIYGEVSKNLAAYSDGYCFYGKATTTSSGGYAAFLLGDDNGTTRIILYQNGGIGNYQANNVNLSDRREKKDFAPSKSYLDVICSIPVQTFRYIDQKDDDLTLGVIAQDVQAVAPELVNEFEWKVPEGESRVRLSIYQTDLQYALMKSIQELNTLITAQSATIQSLTDRITALENKA
jgi:hypothetical protein